MLYQIVTGTGNGTKIHYVEAENQFVAMDHIFLKRGLGEGSIRPSEKIVIACLADNIEVAEGKHI